MRCKSKRLLMVRSISCQWCLSDTYKECPTNQGRWPIYFFHQSLRLRRHWRRSIFIHFCSTCHFSIPPCISSCHISPYKSAIVRAKLETSVFSVQQPLNFSASLSSHSSSSHNNPCWGQNNVSVTQVLLCARCYYHTQDHND
jgi:hypothetical protein